MKKTQEQIQEAIVLLMKLRGTMPQYSIFGDDNHLRIDVQVETLKGEGYKYNNTDFESLVLDVKDWMNGENEDWLLDLRDDMNTFNPSKVTEVK